MFLLKKCSTQRCDKWDNWYVTILNTLYMFMYIIVPAHILASSDVNGIAGIPPQILVNIGSRNGIRLFNVTNHCVNQRWHIATSLYLHFKNLHWNLNLYGIISVQENAYENAVLEGWYKHICDRGVWTLDDWFFFASMHIVFPLILHTT